MSEEFCTDSPSPDKQAVIPGDPLTNSNDGGGGGGPTEVHILYPKKSQLQNLSTQKNHYFF